MEFDRWMRQQVPTKLATKSEVVKVKEKSEYTAALLEDDVIREDGQGGYLALCCKCDRWNELPCDPEEIDIDYKHYCGGSPYCCP